MRLPLKVFSYFLVGALAFVALLSPTAVEAQTANVSVSVSSTDPEVASVMPEGSTWSVTHVDSGETMGDTFSPDHLNLPAVIPVQGEIPTGEYLVTVNAGPTFEAYDSVPVTVDEGTETIPVGLTPAPVDTGPEPGTVTINVSSADAEIASAMPAGSSWTVSDGENTVGDTFAEGDLALPTTIVTNDAIPGGTYTATVDAGPDFAPFSADYTVDGPTSIDVVLTPVPADPDPVLGTVNASVFHCLDRETAGPLTDVGDDCIPGPGSFDFYQYDSDFETTIAVGEDGVASAELPVGTYDVYETTTDTGLGDLDVTADAPLNIQFGIPRTEAPPEETAVVDVSTFTCDDVVGEPVVLGEVGNDCTQISTNLTFYLWGDGTDDSWTLTTSETEASTIELPVGGYDVVNEATQATVGIEVAAGSSAVAIGYPALDTPEPDTGTVTANVWHCLALETPGPLNEVGDDCIPGPAAFDFYMVGDGTDDSVRLTVGDDGVNTATLPVGEYEVYEVSTDTRLDNVVVTAGENSAFSFGIPRVEDPPSETGILSVSTFICEDLDEGVVLDEIGDDCVRSSTDLSFFLWGDGTDNNWPLTTSDAGAVDHELPIGSYEVVDEATQWTFPATVVAGGSEIAFGIPASAEVPVETTLVIQLVLPNDANIEGAPFSIYAPVAAQQFMAEPYVTGAVGPNNVIQVDDLAPGVYRVVVEPDGMSPIDFQVEVGDGVTEVLVTVAQDGAIDVAYGFQDPPPADDPPVTGLPETGTGTGSDVGALGALVSGALLAAGAIGVRIRKS